MKHVSNKFVLLPAAAVLFFSCSSEREASLSFMAMDTFMTLKCRAEEPEKLNQEVKAEVERLEALFSVTDSQSDFYRVNDAAEYPVIVSDSTRDLLELSVKYSELTDGAFDITMYPVLREWGFTNGNYHVPSSDKIDSLLKNVGYKNLKLDGNFITLKEGQMLDPGAVGKGYAGDAAIELYKKNGVRSALIDLGGNIQLLGKKPDGKDWRVALRNPWGGSPVLTVKVHDCAVITSGGYERHFVADDGKSYIHIFDPATGRPVDNSLVSATIIAEKGVYADALSTAVFVMGEEKAFELWKKCSDFEMVLLKNDRSAVYTEGLEKKLEMNFDFTSVTVLKRK